ncbi:MAG: geranylgeranylglycerol-phosphate geranylgeranyltransferase [Bacteroidota bacterium]
MLGIFRLPNLIIVAATQYLLHYLVLMPALNSAGLSPSLNLFHFSLLVFTTVLIAAGGYVINDIIDYKTDLINKPEKVFIGNVISPFSATLIYGLLTTLGTAIALYLADHVNNYWLFFIYPAMVILLFFYSVFFKKMPIIGNVVVSFFCAGVAGVVLFSERKAFATILDTQPELGQTIKTLFYGYIIFAFITTLLREVIKDMEDVAGDELTGLKTLPITFGMKTARHFSLSISFVLLIGVFVSNVWLSKQHEWLGVIFSFAFLISPMLYVSYLIIESKHKQHFTTLSKWMKLIMLAGLILLIVIWKS